MRPARATVALLLFSFAGHTAPLFHKDTVSKPLNYDTNYIFDYKNLLSTRLYFLIQDSRFVIDPAETGRIIYKPNLPYKIGIGGFYSWFGLALAIGSPFHIHDEATQGETKSFDLRLNLYSNVFAIEGYLNSTKGFYTSNYTDPDGRHYINPDLRLTSVGAYGYYILNHRKFSLRSVYVQNEWQKKSAGSFIGRIGFNVSNMAADSGYLPADWIRDYGADSMVNITKGAIVSVSLALGYAYTLVFLKRCYLHAGAFAGAQYNFLKGSTDEVTDKFNVMALAVSLRGAVGYVGKKFHAGFSAILPGIQPFRSGNYNFFWDPPQYRLWFGTRFDIFRKNKVKK